jgi:hypothetical protein
MIHKPSIERLCPIDIILIKKSQQSSRGPQNYVMQIGRTFRFLHTRVACLAFFRRLSHRLKTFSFTFFAFNSVLMGLTDYLFDTYRRYKADTTHIFGWLAETARKYGYTPSDPASSRSTDSPSTEVKPSKGDRTTSSKATSTHKLTVQQVTDIADWIANLNPPVPVPNLIVTFLQSAISARKQCAEWFQSNATDENEKNTTHTYFINVLERVLQVLHPRSSLSGAEQTQSKLLDDSPSSDQQIIDLVDNFGILSIEESELQEINAVTSRPAASNAVRPSSSNAPIRFEYEIEIEMGDDEIYFALFCFFKDLQAIRNYMSNLWRDYRSGETDLVTASLTTNLSFDMVRQAERDLLEQFPMLKSYQDVWLAFYLAMCFQRGVDPIHLQDKPELAPPEMRDIDDLLYANTYRMLSGFFNVIKPGRAPIYRPGHYGIYNPKVDRAQLNDYERFREDKIILVESMTEFFVLTK